jgi:Methyltransferase domain
MMTAPTHKVSHRSAFTKPMHWLGRLLPTDFLKTFVYLNFIKQPRRILRTFTSGFYRMDIIYDVLTEFKANFKGPFSILELGTANGYSFVKMLYATRYLGMESSVTVHAFDSFSGLSGSLEKEESGMIANAWEAGQYCGDYQRLRAYCEEHKYSNYRIHQGYFGETLTPDLIGQFKRCKPILVWVDCDYYRSARTAFERLLPTLRTGTVIYFDDWDYNFGSRFTGEARLAHEINEGRLGEDIELVLDRTLSLDSNRVYRFIHYNSAVPQFERISQPVWHGIGRIIGDGSPLP